jgi:hypothetical protein
MSAFPVHAVDPRATDARLDTPSYPSSDHTIDADTDVACWVALLPALAEREPRMSLVVRALPRETTDAHAADAQMADARVARGTLPDGMLHVAIAGAGAVLPTGHAANDAAAGAHERHAAPAWAYDVVDGDRIPAAAIGADAHTSEPPAPYSLTGPVSEIPAAVADTSRRVRVLAKKSSAIATIVSVVDRMQHVAATASIEATFTINDQRRLKRYSKWGVRHARKGPAQIAAEAECVATYIDELLARVTPEECIAIQAKVASIPPKTVRTRHVAEVQRAPRVRAQPGHLLPFPMDALPRVELLVTLADPPDEESLESRRARWQEALSVVRGKNTHNMGRVLENAAKMDAIAKRRQVYLLKETERSAKAAMAKVLGCAPSPSETRWAQRIWRAPNMVAAGIDRRWERTTEPLALCPFTMALVLQFYFGRTGASRRSIAKLVNAALVKYEAYARRDGYTEPLPRLSKSTVQRFVQALPTAMAVIREKGFTEFRRQGRIVDRYDEATYANEIWEIDHTPLDIACILSSEQPDEIVTVHATACVDAYSGLPVAVFLSSQTPNAFTTSLVLRMAIQPKVIAGVRVGGLPMSLRPDHGKDFMSTHVAKVAAALPILLDPAAQYHPDGKPHVERFFRTLNEQLAEFPGYTPADGRSDGAKRKRADRLLTVRQLIEQVQELITDMMTRPLERGRGTPLKRYAETAQWREPVSPDELEFLLLKEEDRVLTREGIRIRNIFYKGLPDTGRGHNLIELVGKPVIVRYHPDILDAIYVYTRAGEMIGEFVREELWRERIGAVAVNGRVLPSLQDMVRGYSRQLETDDRRLAKAARIQETEQRIAERIAAESGFGPPPMLALCAGTTDVHVVEIPDALDATTTSDNGDGALATASAAPSVDESAATRRLSGSTKRLLRQLQRERVIPSSVFDDLPD